MTVTCGRLLAVVPLALCLGVAGAAAEGPERPDASGRRAPGARPISPASLAATSLATRMTMILGTAWTADNAPIKRAPLRLRNVVNGKIEATTLANEAGQFAFDNVPGGSYVVELLDDGGRVVVIGNVFTIGVGETVATFVRMGTKLPWFDGFFSNTVTAVSSTAASQGVTAMAPLARSVSPKK